MLEQEKNLFSPSHYFLKYCLLKSCEENKFHAEILIIGAQPLNTQNVI
jgi:hypothetical protein